MNKFIWHSKSTEDSGDILSDVMEIENEDGTPIKGTVPPVNFQGIAICMGAKAAEVFKWDSRKFKAVFNDPRKIAPLVKNKSTILAQAKTDGNFVQVPLAISEISDFSGVLEKLDTTGGFYCCTGSLTGLVKVENQQGLQDAVADGLTRAVPYKFNYSVRRSMVVVNGKIVHCYGYTNNPKKVLMKMAEKDGIVSQDKYDFLVSLHEKGMVKIPEEEVAIENLALDYFKFSKSSYQPIIDGIGNSAQMYRIDFVPDKDNNDEVMNIVFSPSLEVIPHDGRVRISSGIKEWVKENEKSYKKSLMEMVAEADEEEAEVMMQAIAKYVNA